MGALQSWWLCGVLGDNIFFYIGITELHLVIFEEMFTVEQNMTVIKYRLEYDKEQDDLSHHSDKLDLW